MGKWVLVMGYIGQFWGCTSSSHSHICGGPYPTAFPNFSFVFLPHKYSSTAPLQKAEANSSVSHPCPSLSSAQSISRVSSSAAITIYGLLSLGVDS